MTGVVVAGIGAVLGGLVLSDTSKVDGDATLCPNKQCTAAGQDVIDSARSKATASSVLIPVGGALAVAGIVMLIIGTQASGSEPEAPGAAPRASCPCSSRARGGSPWWALSSWWPLADRRRAAVLLARWPLRESMLS